MRCNYCRVPLDNEAICPMCGAPNENEADLDGMMRANNEMLTGGKYDPHAGGVPPPFPGDKMDRVERALRLGVIGWRI